MNQHSPSPRTPQYTTRSHSVHGTPVDPPYTSYPNGRTALPRPVPGFNHPSPLSVRLPPSLPQTPHHTTPPSMNTCHSMSNPGDWLSSSAAEPHVDSSRIAPPRISTVGYLARDVDSDRESTTAVLGDAETPISPVMHMFGAEAPWSVRPSSSAILPAPASVPHIASDSAIPLPNLANARLATRDVSHDTGAHNDDDDNGGPSGTSQRALKPCSPPSTNWTLEARPVHQTTRPKRPFVQIDGKMPSQGANSGSTWESTTGTIVGPNLSTEMHKKRVLEKGSGKSARPSAVSPRDSRTSAPWDVRSQTEDATPQADHASSDRNSDGPANDAPLDGISPVAESPIVPGMWPGRRRQTFHHNYADTSTNQTNSADRVAQDMETDGFISSTQATVKIESKQITCEEMFRHLVAHGCVDLSSAMDPEGYSPGYVQGGAFGDIWRGKLLDGTEVAIKVWRFSSLLHNGCKSMKRAMREIYHWSKAKHEYVQELMGVIMFQGRLGMVSRWMEHGNLREYICKNPRADRYVLCIQVATGLAYLHSREMIHGDLKGTNILVSGDGAAKLSDFDHSIMSDCSLAFSETSKMGGGTTRWMAPELIVENSCSRSAYTDVYALGMTMLEIITGTSPYYPQYKADVSVIFAVAKKTLPMRPMDCLSDNLRDNRMWELLLSCWSSDPLVRPKATDVVESLQAIYKLPTLSDLV